MNEKLEKALENRKNKQQEKLIIDFDEAVAEEKAQAIEVKFDGKTYELPQNAPAWLPLFINRYAGASEDKYGNEIPEAKRFNENGEPVLDDSRNLEMIERLLGNDFANKITDESNNFVSFELVNDKILKPVMQRWGMGIKDETEAKNAKTPGS